jgi:putative ABC transport system permease protein
MLAFKLAYRNLMGAGLRTWLNVFVLSLSFVLIIWHKGFLDGWNRQARLDTINWEIGGGQYWHKNYDPYDPFSLQESHSRLPTVLQSEIDLGNYTPLLFSQATIYPEGRIMGVILKGIDPSQKILTIPAEQLLKQADGIPAIIGSRMANSTKLKSGDFVTVRWRDVNGAFDAAELQIVGMFRANVPAIDNGQIWIPLEQLQEMKQLPGEATMVVKNQKSQILSNIAEWIFRSQDYLLAEIDQVIKQKTVGGSIFYFMLLSLAMLAIFDTQVLSIFRRQKEIGTNIALGMTRAQVIRLFTVEGAMHGILAVIVAAIYGIPFLFYQAKHGLPMPQASDNYGLAIAEKIFPVYSVALVIGTIILVLLTTTIVSFIPTRKISKMKPTDAIRGKIQ